MGRVSTYLNFMGQTEEAMAHYGEIFGHQPTGLVRFAEMPGLEGLSPEESQLVMHVELEIMEGHVLQATDMLASMGHEVRVGNNTTIALEPDSREEADRLFDALSVEGSQSQGMSEMPFGYWGTTLDRYGIRWMVTYSPR